MENKLLTEKGGGPSKPEPDEHRGYGDAGKKVWIIEVQVGKNKKERYHEKEFRFYAG